MLEPRAASPPMTPMNRGTACLYRFGSFEVDPSERKVTDSGSPVAISPRVFDLLLYMVRNPGRLLTKDELLKSVWGDLAVEDGNLTQSVFLLRKAFSGSSPIVTIPGRGYQFAASVEEITAAREAEFPAPAPKARLLPWLVAAGLLVAALAAGLLLVPGQLHRQTGEAVPAPRPVTTNSAESPVISQAISADGRYLAYASPESITVQTLNTDETRSLPVPTGVTPMRVTFYPDGTRLLVSQRVQESADLFVFSILSGKLSLLRRNAINPTVSPDGNRVAYADGTNRELWFMSSNGEHPRRILVVPAPDKVYAMFWSPDSRRVWFARVHWDNDRNTTTLETCDLDGANRTVVLSDNNMTAFQLLPKGRLIYALMAPPRNFTDLWELPVNSIDGKPQGPPRKLTSWTNFSISGISATADGRHIALLNGGWQAAIYIGDLRAGGAELVNRRRLTLSQSNNYPSFWTPDDLAVNFESNRNGRSQIFRQRLDQTVPELLSTDSAQDQDPEFGGSWTYFLSVPAGSRLSWNHPMEIRRMPANGGASSEVMRDTGVDVGCASAQPEVCVLARLRDKTLTFYHFEHIRGAGGEIGHMMFDSPLNPSFAVSPDGLAIAAVDPQGAGNRIRLTPIDGGAGSVVEVTGRKELDSLFFAADGKGWFVSSVTPNNGEYLLHVNSRGESQVLFEQPQDGRNTWGVPSHNGRQLAYLQWSAPKNVWMIDDF